MHVVLFLSALLLLAVGSYLAFLANVAGASATYGAAVFCLIFVFLRDFKSFKGFGLEAELLERKIEEADKTLYQLRAITVPIAEMLFSNVARANRIGGQMPRRQRHELMERIQSELRTCGVRPEQIEKAKVDWHRFNLIDLSRPVLNPLEVAVEAFMGRELQKVGASEHTSPGIELAEAYREKVRGLRGRSSDPSLPNLVEEFINSASFLDDDAKRHVREEVEGPARELRHYHTHRDFLDREKWFANG
ncbi:hypothetical protein [Halomonas sp. BL6]|uniref:hypothetical protein n=1 Tax=Halomonas sp. BL6 TaxID=2585770 RepID=UPI001117FA86|nr:hypothetical protein [Halomonas sp. BL6]TNH19662.1 hypothetical protein FHJ80_00305 [Halomonas sp. BL6]